VAVNLASGVDWDAGNLVKCQVHGVSIAEIESFFRRQPRFAPDTAHSGSEDRFIAVGTTEMGRALFVAFTFRERDGRRLVRPISARYMHLKEAKRYGQESAGIEN
jgi:uncharacterized DUF497 family protein